MKVKIDITRINKTNSFNNQFLRRLLYFLWIFQKRFRNILCFTMSRYATFYMGNFVCYECLQDVKMSSKRFNKKYTTIHRIFACLFAINTFRFDFLRSFLEKSRYEVTFCNTDKCRITSNKRPGRLLNFWILEGTFKRGGGGRLLKNLRNDTKKKGRNLFS